MKLTGIIDIGSNSMRLSIMKQLDNGGYYVVDEQKSTPRLANFLVEGELSPAGVTQLLLHLSEFRGICNAFGVHEIVAIGTAALRAATNQTEILKRVRQEIGFAIEVVSGDQEALLGTSAVKHTLDVRDAYLIDIGGGSSEVSLIQDGQLIGTRSLPFGAVTLSREWDQPFAPQDGLQLPKKLCAAFADLPFSSSNPEAEIIGIGGTIRNIARVHQVHNAYPLALSHNYTMSASQVWQTLEWLASHPLTRRKKIEGLSRERADVIIPGGAILLSLMRQTGADQLRISGRGLRDGAFYTRVLGEPTGPYRTVLESSVQNTLRRFQASEDHAAHVTKLAFDLYSPAVAEHLVPATVDKILFAAAMLHRIGVQVGYYNYDLHTFYLIFSSSIYGLTHREIVMTAAAASFKGRRRLRQLCEPYQSLLSEDDLNTAMRLGVLVRLAEALDRRHEKRVGGVKLKLSAGRFDVWLPQGSDAEVELSAAIAWAPHVKKAFGKTLSIGV